VFVFRRSRRESVQANKAHLPGQYHIVPNPGQRSSQVAANPSFLSASSKLANKTRALFRRYELEKDSERQKYNEDGVVGASTAVLRGFLSRKEANQSPVSTGRLH